MAHENNALQAFSYYIFNNYELSLFHIGEPEVVDQLILALGLGSSGHHIFSNHPEPVGPVSNTGPVITRPIGHPETLNIPPGNIPSAGNSALSVPVGSCFKRNIKW